MSRFGGCPAALGVALFLLAATPVTAQVPSYMPAIIGAAVGNALQSDCRVLTQKLEDGWTPAVDGQMQAYVAASAAGDAKTLGKLLAKIPDGGEFGLDGVLRDREALLARPGIGAESKVERLQIVYANNYLGARSLWKLTTADGLETFEVVDFQHGWGVWRVWRARQYAALADVPPMPDKFCHLTDIADLW